MKLFVTGGTGFVGSHFLNTAHARGHEIVALRRPGSRPRIELHREPAWIDAALDADLGTAFDGIDAVVHLASHTPNPPYDTLERCLYWNVQASMQMAGHAVRAGARRFVVAGTCFEYGLASDRYDAIPVDAPLEPNLAYPISKAAASVAFLGLARQERLQLQLMRIFQVYGEGEPATRFWPGLRAAAREGRDFPMSPGLQVRDFVAVESVAAQLCDALAFDGVPPGAPRIAHVASGHAQSLIEFARHWWREWGATGRLIAGAVPMRTGEVMRIVPEMPDPEEPSR
jgi:nucleoside-diphosphate-sugar epimerase